MHGTNNITSFNGALHGTNNITFFHGHCMEQTTSLLLWALHGTNNITSSMGIARTSPSFICWTHDFHQNIKKSSNAAAAGASTFLGHNNNFCSQKLHCTCHCWLLDKDKKQKNKTNIQWIDLPLYAMQWESTFSLCQYEYHLASRVSDHINQ
jgi:hypothetical protein